MIAERRRAAGTTSGIGLILAAGVAAAIGLGALTAVQPLAGMGVAGLIVGAMLLALGRRLEPFFLGCLMIVLAGYAFFGRGFAYVGVSPLFVGEMLLGVGVLTVAMNTRRWRLNLISGLLVLFMGLGLLGTITHVGTHGIDALRDAVIWGYGFFALAIAWTVRREHFEGIAHWYGKVLPAFVIFAPLILLASRTLSGLPNLPGSDVSLFEPKPGDLAVHLAGGAAFILLGLWTRRSELRSMAEYLIWPIWFVGFGLAASLNRGGLTSGAIAIALTLVLRPTRRVFQLTFMAALLLSVTAIVDPEIDLGGSRTISLDQITSNITSVFDSSSNSHLGSTREWRLQWWNDIVDYTVHGEYFWTGKGFGINLADADGYQVEADGTLRSPHNSHMTVLARMGVPGMAVWIILHAAFALLMLATIIGSTRRGDTFLAQMSIWILVYWLAMLINSSFDVFLEGPQGGIWFWTLFGLGLVAYRSHKQAENEGQHKVASPPTPKQPVAPIMSGER